MTIIIHKNMTTETQKLNTTEFNTHSQEYEEVASQQQKTVNNANKKRVQKRKDELKDARQTMSKEDFKKFKEERKAEKQKFKEDKLQARLYKMSPNRRKRYDENKKRRDEIREKKKGMTKDELKQYKQELKEARIKKKDERKQQKKEKVIKKEENMDEKQLARFTKRLKRTEERRNILNSMTEEERVKYKQDKRQKNKERRERYAYLKENWTDTLPETVDHLIIDGNNLRGGGPRRHSRDYVIAHIKKVIDASPQLANANVICMFDRHIAKYEPIEGIDVQFSGDVIADDVIVKICSTLNGTALVITCDRGLALRVLDLGGKVMRNKSFTSIIDGFTICH